MACVSISLDGAGAQREEDKIVDELLAQVLHDAVVGAGALGFLNQAFQLSGALPHVGGEANHMRAVGLAQPGDDRGGIEPARVGEHDEGAGAAVAGLFMHMGE